VTTGTGNLALGIAGAGGGGAAAVNVTGGYAGGNGALGSLRIEEYSAY
jgi:hypothetical protein